MAAAQLGSGLQLRREVRARVVLEEGSSRVELGVCRGALTDEVRVVGVRDAVGRPPQTCDERSLLEREDGLGRSRDAQEGLDRIPALRVRGRVRRTIDHAHPHTGSGGDAPDESGASVERRPDLEMR